MNNIFTNYYKFVSTMENNYYKNKDRRDRTYTQIEKNRRRNKLYTTIAINIVAFIGLVLGYLLISIFANTFNILLWDDILKIFYSFVFIIEIIYLAIINISLLEDYV